MSLQFIFLLIAIQIRGGVTQQEFDGQGILSHLSAPKITIKLNTLNESTHDYDLNPNVNFTLNNSTILTVPQNQYRLTCQAPYLIKWDVDNPAYTRYQTDMIEMTRVTGVNLSESTYQVSLTYEMYTNEGTSGSFICRHQQYDSIYSQLYIFTQVGNFFSQSKQNVTKIVYKSLDEAIVKNVECPSNYFDTKGHDFQLLDMSASQFRSRILDTGIKFDPKIGFVLTRPIKIIDKEINFKCVAKRGGVEDFVFVKYVKSNRKAEEEEKALSFYFPPQSAAFFCDLNTTVTGEVANDQIMLKSIRCDNPYDCNLAKDCYKVGRNCQAILFGTPCETRKCSRISSSHFSGLAYCKALDYEAFEPYFVGLNFRRYTSSDLDIPVKALIRLDEVSLILYSDERAIFFCEASSFMFMSELQFTITYKNGSILPPPEGNYTLSNENDYEDDQNIGTVQRRLNLTLTSDMTQVNCIAAWYNSSTEWFDISRDIVVRDPAPPLTVKSNLNRIFYLGDMHRNLVCKAEGQPTPTFTWFFNGTEIHNTNFSVSSTQNMESILNFPLIDQTHGGAYTCHVSNRLGNDSTIFNVRAEVPKSSALSKSSVAGIVMGLLIFLSGISIAFYVIWKKYQITKKRLRDLTKEEVAEFTQGNPEVLANLGGDEKLIENAQFLPFKSSYEILDTDLQISKNDILGKGAFGIVYRGRYFGNPVAVKATLPLTDVTTFKALLAEIKVMAYIGKHSNVVAFVGAVTRNIQKRIVYAVMELSPLGNLEAYLKAHRCNFLNLIGGEETIALERSYSNLFKRLSTLDFINWSVQIAAGMNFLASKKVIHGDLAARNILLFHDHVAKITDFGLSRQLYESSQYHKKNFQALPWRWMAIESLKDMDFSVESDVWGYGVTIWEIFTMAEIPYPGYSWTHEFMESLEQGLRLKRPKFATEEIYRKLLTCWHPQPSTRPTFQQLYEYFSEISCQFQGNLEDNDQHAVYANTASVRSTPDPSQIYHNI